MPTNLSTSATLVSLFPMPIFERKPLIPAVYQVAASKKALEPQTLIVKEGLFHVYLDEFRGSMTIRTPAITVAESIVRDFMDGQFIASSEARPALWTLPGEWTAEEIATNEEQAYRVSKEDSIQLEWFKRLIVIADDDWNKFHQHRMVTDMQRIAAARLRVTREWAIEFKPENIIDCPGCGATINKKVAVCRECGCIINMDLYQTLQFAAGTTHAAPTKA